MSKLFPLVCLLLAIGSLRAQEATEVPEAPAEVSPGTGDSAGAPEDSSQSAAPAPTAEAPVIPAEDLASMESKVGSEVTIEGLVADVGQGPNGNITFLNFGDRRTGFVAVVFRAVYERFPEGFDKYAQQKVRVRGMLEKYRDRQMQIKILSPDQVEIVASEAP